MQTIKVRTTQNVFIHYPLASVGDRIVAHLLDKLILTLYSIAIVIFFIQIDLEIWWLWMVVLGGPWTFYTLLFEIFMNGQTPGKRMMEIQVVKMNGTEPTIGDYLLRWIFAFIDLLILGGALAILVILIGGKGQRIGDVVADTTVVKLIAPRQITADEVFVTPEDTYAPTFPQVMQLDARDIELIQRALEANKNFGNQQPVMAVTDRIKELLGIQTDLPPAQFLYTVVKDFNHLNSI
jgi:uncharacterized RDD family membrane protein YckC